MPRPTIGGDGGFAQPALEPPRLLGEVPAIYPAQLAAQGLAGEAKLQLLVGADGRVGEITLVEASHPLFAESAKEAAAKLVFAPATVEGQPVPVRLFFSYRFEAPQVRPSPPAPTATLSGLVRAKGTRRPLPGATVRSSLSPQTAETDAEGRFRATFPPGKQVLKVSAPGHKSFAFQETLRAQENVEVIYALEPNRVNPYETIIHGDREHTEVSRVTLRGQELREVPGTMGDPFRVVMLLPGVGSMLSGVAYPVVRGSEPAATGYFIDGIRVPLLFHLFLGPAVVHPDFIESIDFFPGSPPTQYGRLMGGVIDGRISRARDDRLHATAYADFINAGLFVEAPVKKTGTSVTLAGRLSYTPWILALVSNALMPPPPPGGVNPTVVLDFYDYQARIEQRLLGGKLRLFGFGSSDVFGSRYPGGQLPASGGAAEQAVLFHRADARYTRPLGAGEGEVGFTWGLDRLAMKSESRDFRLVARSEFNVDEDTLSGRARYSVPLDKGVRFTVGGDLDHRRAGFGTVSEYSGHTTVLNTPVATATYYGLWAQLVYEKLPRWTFVPGLRVDDYHLVPGVDHLAVEPRLTARRALPHDFTLKAAAGLFHQPPTTLINLPVVDASSLKYGLQEGAQLSAGVEWKPPGAFEVTAEAYFNPLLRTLEFDLISVNGAQVPNPTTGSEEVTLPRGESHGYAYGVELMVRHPLGGNWFGWLSYSLSHSARYARFERYDQFGEVLGTDTRYVPFAFDQTHIANAVLSYKLGSHWTVGTVLHFNTGRPETGLMGQQAQAEGVGPYGNPQWVRIDRDRSPRLPPFFRIDARVAYAHAYQSFNFEAYLDFLNATISQEVVAFSYGTEWVNGKQVLTKTANGIPIPIPIFGIKARY
ncbi:MAG: TonB-dependent receptor domain-containing protein [Myxococcaceae bacterium]